MKIAEMYPKLYGKYILICIRKDYGLSSKNATRGVVQLVKRVVQLAFLIFVVGPFWMRGLEHY